MTEVVFSQPSTYRPDPSSRWIGLGGTLSIYGMVLAVLLVSVSSSVIKPVPSTALTVVAVQSPPSPPDTPPQPRHTTHPAPRKPPLQPSVGVAIVPPVNAPIPVLATPATVSKSVEPTSKPSEATAPKTMPEPPAPSQTDKQADRGPESWQGRVLMRLSSKRRYPASAMTRHQQGVPYIRFTMGRQGQVLAVSLERSSGVPDLDREALALPKRAQPLPKPPEDIRGDTLEIVVPIEFLMR